MKLPAPRHTSEFSLEKSLSERRSVRKYQPGDLKIEEVSQLLWAAQGKSSDNYRTAPSAGALYPVEIYMVCGQVEGLETGVYHYRPDEHEIVKLLDGDHRKELASASVNQPWISEASIDLVVVGVFGRMSAQYGSRGVKYVYMEIGHITENVCLQATALNLGSIVIGAFFEDQVNKILQLPTIEQPVAIVPVGRKQPY